MALRMSDIKAFNRLVGLQLVRLTFADRLEAAGGRPSGFDYLRIVLAISVIFFHSFDLTAGYSVSFNELHGVFAPINSLIVPMFFAASGFLVAGSLERSRTLISFAGLRAIRLVPALMVETVLSAIIIGLLFSHAPLGEYFTSKEFFLYFLNVTGSIHWKLPGVFEHNPFPRTINGQLWTLPYEIKCYLIVLLLAFIGLTRKRYFFTTLIALFTVSLFFLAHHILTEPHGHLARFFDLRHVENALLVSDFMFGMALYFFRRRVIWSKWVFLPAMSFCLLLLSLPVMSWGQFLTPIPVAYATIYLGLTQPRRLKIVSSGDYSYGIYVYGYPVQQAVIDALGPASWHWYINFPISLVIVSLFAFGSWHLVEKRATALRPLLFKLETVCVKGGLRLGPAGRSLWSRPQRH